MSDISKPLQISQQSLDAFQQRMQAVETYVGILKDRYEKASLLDREKTIYVVINFAEKFSKQLRSFFTTISQHSEELILLPDWNKQIDREDVTKNYSFGKMIDQLLNDLTVIELAFAQRTIPEIKRLNGNNVIASMLDTTDKLAWTARMLFEKYLDPATTVLSYLEKSPRVRIIPYAPVMLIGVPATSLTYAKDKTWTRDFLAIPHEFGHHLYWYGRAEGELKTAKEVLDKKNKLNEKNKLDLSDVPFLREGLKTLTDSRLNNWLEEIFADVIGCLIAGPASGLSIQHLMQTARGSELDFDNGTHPAPLLRPFIYTETLKLMDGGALNTVVTLLEQEWKNFLIESRLLKDNEMLKRGSDEWQFTIKQYQLDLQIQQQTTLQIQQMITSQINFKEVKELIKDIFEQVKSIDVIDNYDKRWTGWPIDKLDIVSVDQLYTHFNPQRVQDLIAGMTPIELDVTLDLPLSFEELITELRLLEHVEKFAEWETEWPGWQQRFGIAAGSTDSNAAVISPGHMEVPSEIWVNILKFGGWTTGPGGPGNVH